MGILVGVREIDDAQICEARAPDDLRPLVGLPVHLAADPVHARPPVVQEDVRRLGLGLAVAVHFVDDEVATPTNDAEHLREHGPRVREVVERVRDAGRVERVIGKGQVAGVHLLEPDVGRLAERGREGRRPLAVRVDPNDLRMISKALEQEPDEAACPGRDVEHAPAGDIAEDSLRVNRHGRPPCDSRQELVERRRATGRAQAGKAEDVFDRSEQPVVVVERR
jgi:hypothetical protein